MVETQYKVIEAKKPDLPIRNLLEISEPNLVASLHAFGPNYFRDNIEKMQKYYSHPQTGKKMSFREPTTKESLLIANYDFGNVAKPKIFDPSWLQAGWIVKTSEGVFANPPKDGKGKPITDIQYLKKLLEKAKPVKIGKGNLYIVPDAENLRDFGYADYETFRRGNQESREFAEGGLARLLEHTEEPVAKNIAGISSSEFYPKGVNVCGFGEVKKSVLKVASLDSDRDFDDGRLYVNGSDWGGSNYGYAFGVLKKTSEAGSQNSK